MMVRPRIGLPPLDVLYSMCSAYGNWVNVAKVLGIHHSTLYRYLSECGVEKLEVVYGVKRVLEK